MSGGGKPGCAFGPHGGGENQSVSAGPSPLHETRTKNRRSTTDWKPRIDLTRIGMEHASCEVLPLIFHLVLCTILVLADSLHRIDHPRCVSAKNACIFYRTLTLTVRSVHRHRCLPARLTLYEYQHEPARGRSALPRWSVVRQ